MGSLESTQKRKYIQIFVEGSTFGGDKREEPGIVMGWEQSERQED